MVCRCVLCGPLLQAWTRLAWQRGETGCKVCKRCMRERSASRAPLLNRLQQLPLNACPVDTQ